MWPVPFEAGKAVKVEVTLRDRAGNFRCIRFNVASMRSDYRNLTSPLLGLDFVVSTFALLGREGMKAGILISFLQVTLPSPCP
jgi:hypothetical protein